MVEQFINSLTMSQSLVLMYLVVYLLAYGVKYHLLAIAAYLSGRRISNDWMGVTLNWSGYAAIACCLHWFL